MGCGYSRSYGSYTPPPATPRPGGELSEIHMIGAFIVTILVLALVKIIGFSNDPVQPNGKNK